MNFELEPICETCHSYKPKKCFTTDGICYLVPSKPKLVEKTYKCNFHTERKKTK